MLNKSLVLATTLFTVICLLGLSGCSTAPMGSKNYTSKYRGYTQVSNLPSDYPTNYLPNGNIWNDFRSHMRLPAHLNNRQVQAKIRWYKAHQDFLNRALIRGAQYFYYIYQQTKQRNLPAELALIPIFESGYVPVNRSYKGATGLWQFMPRTAANFKIRMNKWYDGRRDVVASTDAALRYLTYLYYYFDKDWLVAIASYDCGEGNMQSALLRNKRRGRRIDFWSLNLTKETTEYIPQLLALSAIIKNPGKYGISLVPINNGPYFDRIDVGHPIALDKAAKMSGASEWTMRMLNAGLSHGVTEPDGPYVILLPHSKMADFKDALSGKAKVLSTGSTAAKEPVAAAATTTKKISNNSKSKHINALADAAEDEHQKVTSHVNSQTNADDEDNHKKKDQKNPAKSSSKVGKNQLSTRSNKDSSKSSSKANTKRYVVGAGESLFSIARQYNTSAATLKRINNLKSSNIKPGQMLLLPFNTVSASSQSNISKNSRKINSTANAPSTKTKTNSQASRRSKATLKASTSKSKKTTSLPKSHKATVKKKSSKGASHKATTSSLSKKKHR